MNDRNLSNVGSIVARAEQFRLLMADVYELAGASRRTSEELADAAGLTVARWNVLSVVETEAATVPRIADRLGQARQSVQAVTGELEAAGLVAYRANPDHARSPLVRATPAGRRRLASATRAADALRERQLRAAGITTADLASVRDRVRRLLAAVTGPPDR